MMKEPKSPIELLRKIWHWLTEPHPSIEDVGTRRQARFLASLLVALLLLTSLLVLFYIISVFAEPTALPLQNPDSYVTAGTWILFAIAYGMNRAGRYIPAARLTVISFFTAVYAATITTLTGSSLYYDSDDPNSLVMLVMPILFTSILLPIPTTIIVVTVNVVIMLLLPPLFPQVSFSDILTGPVLLILAESILIVLAVRSQTQMVEDRQAELVEREKQYRILLESAFEGLVISTRKEGRLIEVNPGAAKMFGYEPLKALGMSLTDFIAESARAQLAHAVSTGAAQPLESLGLRQDGTEFHIEMITQALIYRDQPVRVVAIRDITERKEAAETLGQQYRELELLNQVGLALGATLNLNQVLATILTEVHRLLDVTAASAWLKDPETGELVCRQVVGPQDNVVRGWRLASGEGIVGQVAESGESLIVPDTQTYKRHFKQVDQQTRIEQRSILSVPLQVRDKVIGVLQILDAEPDRFQLTDQKLVESLAGIAAMAIENAHLYEETDKLRAFNQNIVQDMDEGILIEDVTGCITFVNPKGAEIVGYTIKELKGQPTINMSAPGHRAKVEEETAKRPHGIATRYETILLTKEGRQINVVISARPLFEDGEFRGTLSVFTDITTQKQAEEEIRRRAIQQEAINAVIAAAVAAADLQELLDIVLNQTLRAFGVDIGAIWVGDQQAMRGLSPEIKQSILQTFRAVAMDIPDIVAVEDTQQGDVIPHIASPSIRGTLSVPIMVEGQPIGRLNLGDLAPRQWTTEEVGLGKAVGQQLGAVVERLRLLKQVQEQAEQMQQIVNTVSAGMLLLDSDMRILLANPAAREYMVALCGTEEVTALTHLGEHPIEKLLLPPPERLWHEIQIKEPPHRIFLVAAHAAGLEPETEGWVLVLRDVTQERKIEDRVQRQERLAVVGQLAAGIAHDFNNIMSVIILYTSMLSHNRALSPHDHELLKTIHEQAEQATNLIEQILDFGRTSAIAPKPLNLNPFLSELKKLLERTLPENIALELSFGRGEYMVNADPTRIQQTIMNLVVNARDAMPDGGRLRIRLDRIQVGVGKPAPVPEMKPGEWVQVMMSDTGTGIPPDVLPHIFDPFFTTKAPKKGTGLGLAQVHGIVEQHEGHINVKSQIEQGTTFILYLPALQTSTVKTPKPKASTTVQGHGETILVVEDQQVTRNAIAKTLQLLGYQILTAADGQEAQSVFAQHKHEIALVLSDLVMPGIGGVELIRTLKQQSPKTKIIVMTGYPLDAENQDLSREDFVDWLRKPLNMERLAEAVKRALETEI
ncbi:MAG: PAS domain S-box protein [Chloroflexi bacterium]|nr:PAS domain S-box protein [Chloroflexota bacterium]